MTGRLPTGWPAGDGITADQWRDIYPRIFGKTDNMGEYHWSVTGTVKLNRDRSVKTLKARPGQEDPSISYSAYQYLELEEIPTTFKLESQTHPYFVHIKYWFTEYHFPYCEDVYGTSDRRLLDNNPDFLRLMFAFFTNHHRNEQRSANELMKGLRHVQNHVAAYTNERQAQRRGAHRHRM